MEAVSRIWTVLGQASVVVQTLYSAMNRSQNSPNNPPRQIDQMDQKSVGDVKEFLTQLKDNRAALLEMAQDEEFSEIVSNIDAIEFTLTKEQIIEAQELGQ